MCINVFRFYTNIVVPLLLNHTVTTSVEGQTLLQEQDSITEVVPERLPTETG